jgi:proline dehydrogenase
MLVACGPLAEGDARPTRTLAFGLEVVATMVDLSGVLKILTDRGVASPLVEGQLARSAAAPFLAGETVADVVQEVAAAQGRGVGTSVLYLPAEGAEAGARLVHLQLITALTEADLAAGTDLTVDLGAAGLVGADIAMTLRSDLAATVRAAEEAGMTVTLAGLSHPAIPAGLSLHQQLHAEHPDLGMTVAAHLHRSESDCLDLARLGARVRLVKRGPRVTGGAAFTSAHEVDKAYVRCLRLLVEGGARPIVATEDPRLLDITAALVERSESAAAHSFLFARGLEPGAMDGLMAEGARVSVLEPFGPGWAAYVAQVEVSPATMGKAARSALAQGRD